MEAEVYTPVHKVPNAWAFFTGFWVVDGGVHFGAFFTENTYNGFNEYVSNNDDLPLTAILIPY